MARAAKSAVVLCMDVGFAMSHSNQAEGSPFEEAKKVMMLFLQRQVFAESKDEIAVVLFGTDGTDNALACGDQYENITVLRHLMLPDFDLLEEIQNTIHPGSAQADFLDALIVSMDILQKETLGKKFERLHIAVFTDLSSPFSEDQLEIIIANLKKAGITLQFFLPFSIDEEEDHRGDHSQGDSGNSSRLGGPCKGLSDRQKDGTEMVKKIMYTLEGEDGMGEVYSFRYVPFIHCQCYFKVTEEKVKKTWNVVDAKSLKKEDVKKETVYCLNNDEETEVAQDDTIQGFRYGSDIVPFSKVDQEQMKYKSEGKCFEVLGFTKSSLAASVALSALINALDETDMVAIVRYVYDKRSNPQVGVAFPRIKDKYE
ncbi:hypothetical protein GDO86_019628, partial [Hymenochirus boettgeri]